MPPPVPAVPELERFPSVPEENDAEEIDESPDDQPQEPLEFGSEENLRGSFDQNQNPFTFQDQQRPSFNFPQSPRALNPNQSGARGQSGGLGGANNFLFNRGRNPQIGNSGFNLPQSGRNINSFNQPQNPGFGGGFGGFGGQGGQGGRGKELVASFQGQPTQPGGGFRQQSQGFPRNQQSFNNPQIKQGFNSFSQPGFRGSFNPTQSNFGNNGFGRSFGKLPQAQTPRGFGSEVGGQVNLQGNPNLEVETFQPGNVSVFSFYLTISLITAGSFTET